MVEWQIIKLSEVVQINVSTYSTNDKWDFVNYLDTGNIVKNTIALIQRIELAQGEELPSRARRKVEIGDIVYSTVRPNQLHYGFIEDTPINFLVSTGFAVLHPIKNKIDGKFLYYLLVQQEITEKLQSIAEQSTSAYPAIKPSDIEALDFAVPEMKVQKKISNILSLIDKKIELNAQINHNLEEQVKALYWDQFPYSVDDKLPAGWQKGSLGNILVFHDSKRIPLSSAERARRSKIYPYYGAASQMDYVDDYLFDGVYLLLGEDGTVVTDTGFPILQYVWGKFWVNNHAHILTGKSGFCVETLWLLLSNTPVKSIVTGAVQPKISQANLKGIPVVIPPEEIIKKFGLSIAPLFKQIRNNTDENKKLAQLRDTLLPKLMSGEIDVSEVEI